MFPNLIKLPTLTNEIYKISFHLFIQVSMKRKQVSLILHHNVKKKNLIQARECAPSFPYCQSEGKISSQKYSE